MIQHRSKTHNKANQRGALKALRQKRATLLTPSYLRRYVYKKPNGIKSKWVGLFKNQKILHTILAQ